MVNDLYDALRQAGADEEKSRAAARAVLGAEEKEQLATKVDLEGLRLAMKADIADLKAEMYAILNRHLQVQMGLMIAMTGIFAAIVKLL